MCKSTTGRGSGDVIYRIVTTQRTPSIHMMYERLSSNSSWSDLHNSVEDRGLGEQSHLQTGGERQRQADT